MNYYFEVRSGNRGRLIRFSLGFLCFFLVWSNVLFSAVPSEERLRTTPSQTFIQVGDTLQAAARWTEARTEFEKALALPDCTAGERHQTLVKIAAGFLEEADDSKTLPLLERVLGSEELEERTRASALLLLAKVYFKYGDRPSWQKVREACRQVLSLKNISQASHTAAREAIVAAYLSLAQIPEARRELEVLTAMAELPSPALQTHLVALARVLILEQAYAEARTSLHRASSLLDTSTLPLGDQDEMRAEIQLLRGLSFIEEGNSERAKTELLRVVGMAGQSAGSPQTREALVRLSLRKWVPEEEATLNVLFIGSSHTIRGNVPLLVEQLAASAPAGTPRIRAGEHVRTGTGMRVFWEEGEAKHTARGKIAAESWDAVVVETFYRNPREVLEEYAVKFAGLAREKGARLVVYETPVAKETAYPAGFIAFHEENVRLGRILELPVAPSVHAWMQILGGAPTSEKMDALYADWIHASLKGAYLTACCVYSALTNRSPAGLTFPKGISSEEAALFQKTAWNSFQETEAAKRR